jgi:hypothetical protein
MASQMLASVKGMSACTTPNEASASTTEASCGVSQQTRTWVQDRDAARPLVWNLCRCCTRIRLAWADASRIHRTQAGRLGHPAEDPAGDRPQARRARLRNPAPPLGHRGTLAWMISCRQCARDYERLPESHEAIVLWAMTALMA